ncbi:MAG: apolipoprotein N-acyltransferase [Phenylobacterium sp.]|uniref:apolipoprotein N-acyltransferase n=1 Tax=Phenylobacterium sp. TaxID=1871053 RepID=UPI00272846E9|nr:apolipoprotein N-acyltransferase [Phenylobacterium sp.]MDO8899736.1 apolipoprotein N-acyltransferase [Phenylobacterium sp.]
MQRLASLYRHLEGHSLGRAGLALGAGLAAALAHPPFGVLPGLLGFAVILRLADQASPRRPLASAFFRGWLAGLGYFALSVWWVTEAFLVDAAAHGWMAPFALVLLAGGLALFWGGGIWLYRLARPQGPARMLVFAGALALAEWTRGHIFTGFPWNLPGEAWRAGGAPSQTAALVGAYGLTWITLALAATPAVLPGLARRQALAVSGAAIAVLAGLYGGGAWRLATAPAPRDTAPLVRIVQADVDQKTKWRPENLDLIFDDYVRLSALPAPRRPDVVIWPEGALPAVIDDLLAPGQPYPVVLAQTFAPGQVLMLGANRVGLGENGAFDYFNTLVAFRRMETPGLEVVGIYDKHRLVPFGEYLPFGDTMTRLGLRSLVNMPADFTPGPPPQPLTLPGLPPVQPLICYEALFPRFTAQAGVRGGIRAEWILNVSNDAWFGATSGPWQHLNLASYRAIEEGLPMVRSTPTGVSGVIDSRGRLQAGAWMSQGRRGVIDAQLPPPEGPTPFSRLGALPFAIMLLVSGAIVGVSFIRRRGRGAGRPHDFANVAQVD